MILAAELTDDPLALGYAGMTDAACDAALNAPTRLLPIQSADVLRYLMVVDKWPEIVRVARFGDASADKTRAAIRMVEALAGLSEFDMSVPAYAAAIGGGLDALVSAGLASADDKTAILALAKVGRSRAAELGLGAVTASDVARARAA